MYISLKLLLALLLFVTLSFSILGSTLGLNSDFRTADAREAPNNNSQPSISYALQAASYSLFPFWRDLQSSGGEEAATSITNRTTNTTDTRIGTAPATNLSIISGTWQPTTEGVQAGDMLDTLQNVLVRPETVNSTNLDINTSFTVNSLPPNTASYISIVYSFNDLQNFKYAGITFYNNQTYADFGTVSDGTLTWEPEWPGQSVEIDWIPGDPIRMTLSLRADGKELNVNGIESLQQDSSDNESGKVGLSYGRVQDVVFDRFIAEETTE